jgi:hypothetical protein
MSISSRDDPLRLRQPADCERHSPKTAGTAVDQTP